MKRKTETNSRNCARFESLLVNSRVRSLRENELAFMRKHVESCETGTHSLANLQERIAQSRSVGNGQIVVDSAMPRRSLLRLVGLAAGEIAFPYSTRLVNWLTSSVFSRYCDLLGCLPTGVNRLDSLANIFMPEGQIA